MFTRAAKSVVKNFGQRNYHAAESSFQNTWALVPAAEGSGVPGILNPLVGQTAEKPVSIPVTTSEQNGLVAFVTKRSSPNAKVEHHATKDRTALIPETGCTAESQRISNSNEANIPQSSEFHKSEGEELLDVIWKLPVKDEICTSTNRLQSKKFPISDFSQNLGISKQLKTPGAKMCGQLQDSTCAPKDGQRNMRWTVEGTNCDDQPSERNKTAPYHPPGTPSASLDRSTDPVREENKGRKPLCVKCPQLKKPRKFFSNCPDDFLITSGEGTQRAEPGIDFCSSTPQSSESRNYVNEATSDCSFLFPLEPGCDFPKRWYGKCGDGPKGPSKPGCPPPKKTPDCPRPSKPPSKPCPPSKPKFVECPPPPKLPKLPKCPPPCPPPSPPPIPKCPTPPKCPPPPPPCAPPQNKCPPSSPPKKKCNSREMSTHSLLRCDLMSLVGAGTSGSSSRRGPVFLVSRRRLSSSSTHFASKGKSENGDNRNSKDCKKDKKIEDKCSPKKPVQDRCAKPKTKGHRNCKPQPKCSTGCAPRPRCPPLPPPPPKQSNVQWTPPICSPPKLVGPPPCPELAKPESPQLEPSTSACPPPPPLPKPPCRPVCLCPCPPPPKLPPGTCPDVTHDDERSQPSCPPPCPPKAPIPCPKDTLCPSKPICPSKK